MNKKSFNFLSSSKTRDSLKFYSLSGATFYDHINTIYQIVKTFLEKKMVIFEEYGAFKVSGYTWGTFYHFDTGWSGGAKVLCILHH